MSDDLVKRLRNENVAASRTEAADRIEQLTAERDRLRAALIVYADPCDATETNPCGYEGNLCCRIARAALKGETP